MSLSWVSIDSILFCRFFSFFIVFFLLYSVVVRIIKCYSILRSLCMKVMVFVICYRLLI